MHAGGRGRGGDLVDGGLIEPEELALVDGDERLPWLEADEDFDENEVDTGRVIAFVLVGLLFLGLIIGGLWLYFRESTDSAIIADGSTIEAPDEPYKTRPQNPGGAEALGTGDTSFAVAEGQSLEGRVAVSQPPSPSIDREQTGTDGPEESAAPAGVGVQVGACALSREA